VGARQKVKIRTAVWLLAAILAAMLLLAACKQPARIPGPYVQAAGYIESTTDIAVSWKADLANVDPQKLTELSAAGSARAAAVYVSGADVYVAGYLDDGIQKAGYWKNGTWVPLWETTTAAATDIVVSGSEVYVSGYYTDSLDGYTVACYWKNDSAGKVDLYDSATMSGRADGIAFDGVDVHVAGTIDDDGGSKKTACYWKNNAGGQVILDLDPTPYSQGYAVAVSGTDVYVAGYYVDGGLKAGYWENGTWVLLHGTSNAKAFDIVVSGTDVYVAGYYANGTPKNVACYWKNGAVEILYDNAAMQGGANGIFIDVTDVYVAGNFDDDGSTKKACYWKNGVRTTLATTTSDSFSLAIMD
jgi:hypothetical protein